MTEVLSEHNIAKAERLLTDRKVTLTHVSGDLVKATVKGDTGTRFVVADRFGIRCSCPASAALKVCAHMLAVSYVTGRFDDDS